MPLIPSEQKTLACIRYNQMPVTFREIVEATGYSKSTIRDAVKVLKQKNLIAVVPSEHLRDMRMVRYMDVKLKGRLEA